jgi:hypothetical protein
MPKYSGVMIRKEYFDVEVIADNEEQAKELIMQREIEHDSYDMGWEFCEDSIVDITKEKDHA